MIKYRVNRIVEDIKVRHGLECSYLQWGVLKVLESGCGMMKMSPFSLLCPPWIQKHHLANAQSCTFPSRVVATSVVSFSS